MKNTLIFINLSLLTLFCACKTPQYTPTDFPDAQITFGSGGGFTGSYSFFTLLQNGQLFRKEGNEGKYTELGRVGKDVANQLFKNYEVLDLANVQYDEPDNMSYYIEYKDKGEVHRITWGGAAVGLKKEVKLFYQLLNDLRQSAKK